MSDRGAGRTQAEWDKILDSMAAQTTALALRLAMENSASEPKFVAMAAMFGAVLKLAGENEELHPHFRGMVRDCARQALHMVVVDPEERIEGLEEQE